MIYVKLLLIDLFLDPLFMLVLELHLLIDQLSTIRLIASYFDNQFELGLHNRFSIVIAVRACAIVTLQDVQFQVWQIQPNTSCYDCFLLLDTKGKCAEVCLM